MQDPRSLVIITGGYDLRSKPVVCGNALPIRTCVPFLSGGRRSMTDLAFSPSVQVDGIRDVCWPWAMLLGGRRADPRVSDLRGWRVSLT